MIFSSRTPDDLSPNPIARALEQVRGTDFIDLTESNPTRCGFTYPADLLSDLSHPEALRYDPHALGSLSARRTLADYLNIRGHQIDPENLVLTASTSEAYSYLFKLLGDPGDAFLAPTPGYPLLDHLLHLEALELIPYPAHPLPGWPLDLPALKLAVTHRTKGVIVVDPNNPTGATLSGADRQALWSLCEERNLAYIIDEVFSDYLYEPATKQAPSPSILSFRLGGLSKSLGLPQLKLSWIELSGPERQLAECRNRLELIADTYLSVNTPVQVGLEKLLAFAPNIQKQILDRIFKNHRVLESLFAGSENVKVWPTQGGWYALLEVLSEGANAETLALEAIQKHQVNIQPGGFYDLAEGCFLVVSLLPQLEIFRTGANRLKKLLN